LLFYSEGSPLAVRTIVEDLLRDPSGVYVLLSREHLWCDTLPFFPIFNGRPFKISRFLAVWPPARFMRASIVTETLSIGSYCHQLHGSETERWSASPTKSIVLHVLNSLNKVVYAGACIGPVPYSHLLSFSVDALRPMSIHLTAHLERYLLHMNQSCFFIIPSSIVCILSIRTRIKPLNVRVGA
jgi:hypothetical protein